MGYFWPVYGELHEVCFPYFESRRHEHVQQALGLAPGTQAVLVTDGCAAYSSYAKKTGITHAQCWIHTRRTFLEAKDAEPQAAGEALSQIAALHEIEQQIQSWWATRQRPCSSRTGITAWFGRCAWRGPNTKGMPSMGTSTPRISVKALATDSRVISP